VVKFGINVERGQTKTIDILPFIITQNWYKNLRSKSGSLTGLEVGDWDYKLEVPVHGDVGDSHDMFICLQQAFGKPCCLCDELYAEWDKEKGEQDKAKINSLMTSWRCFYNVYDYDGKSGGIELGFNIAYKNFEEMLQDAVDSDPDGLVTFWDLEDGRSIQYKTKEKKFDKNTYHEAHSITFLEREKYGEDILEKTHSLDAMLIIPTPDDVARAHYGLDEEETQQPQEERASEPRQINRSRPGGAGGGGEQKAQEQIKEETPAGECPAGGTFGKDCNQLKACESCDEDLFKSCAQAAEEAVPVETPADPETQKEEEPAAKAPPVRRRRSI